MTIINDAKQQCYERCAPHEILQFTISFIPAFAGSSVTNEYIN